MSRMLMGWILCSLLLALGGAAFAQEEAAAETETGAAAEAEVEGQAEAEAEPEAEAADEEDIEGLGVTQGQFALQVIHEVRAERFFEGALTARKAADRLAYLGLAPEGGWRIGRELTRGDLESAYGRLLGTLERATDLPPEEPEAEGEGEEPPPETPISEMTIAELMEKISEAVRKALAVVTTERQPISPSRPLWR